MVDIFEFSGQNSYFLETDNVSPLKQVLNHFDNLGKLGVVRVTSVVAKFVNVCSYLSEVGKANSIFKNLQLVGIGFLYKSLIYIVFLFPLGGTIFGAGRVCFTFRRSGSCYVGGVFGHDKLVFLSK
jgi:hypothetical protein